MDPTVQQFYATQQRAGIPGATPDGIVDEEGQDRIFALMQARKSAGTRVGLYSRSAAASADAPSKAELRRYAGEVVLTAQRRVAEWRGKKKAAALQAAEDARQKTAAVNETQRQQAAVKAEEKRAADSVKAERLRQSEFAQTEADRRAESLRADGKARDELRAAEEQRRGEFAVAEARRRAAAAAEICSATFPTATAAEN
jgi:hypothetical protein